MTTSALLVTGASGQLGRHVLDGLLAQKIGPIIATTRQPDQLKDYAAKGVEVRQADFDSPNPAALAKAFSGARRALLISTDAVGTPGRRLAQHLAALKAFESAGVEHVVYTSVTNPKPDSQIPVAPDHRATEEALAASTLGFTVLRNSLYADLALTPLQSAIASGQLVDARENGRAGFVTREDCARAAAAALAASFSGRRTLELTGPAALTSNEVAAIVSQLSGRPVKHVSVSPEAYKAALIEHNVPPPVADVYVGFDVAIAAGELDVVSDAVEQLTGRPAQSFRDFLAADERIVHGPCESSGAR